MLYIEQYPELVPPVIIFLLAFFLALHGTWLMRRLSLALRLLDHPGPRKSQVSAVPSCGGVAIVLAVSVALFLTYGRSAEIRLILLVGLGIAITGLLDDIFSVSAPIKLLVLAAGCLVLMSGGIGLNRTPYAIVNYLLTFLWVAGIASAFNAIDNADGLAGSIAVVSAVALFIMGWSTWQLCFSFLSMALAGGVLGFLHFNLKPARIYMGDTGSFFLGYILAVLVIYGQWSESGTRAFLAGCFVLGLPIYDLGLTSVLRIRHGVVSNIHDVIAYSDHDHLSHRLLKLGLSHRKMLTLLCGGSAVCCLVAVVITYSSWAVSVLTVITAVVLFAGFGAYLDLKTSRPELWSTGEESQTKKKGPCNREQISGR